MPSFWSCVTVHPHQEALALRNIRRQGFTSFYPFSLVANNRRRLVVRPLFPGYIFIQLDDQVFNWSPLNNTLGVRRLITATTAGDYRYPARVPFADDLWRLRLRPSSVNEPELIPPGTIVRVLRGPFQERTGLVELSEGDRVKLLLQAFNREVSIEFSVENVQLIRRPTGTVALA